MLLLISLAHADDPGHLLSAARSLEPHTCGTDLVRRVRDGWSGFSPEQQDELRGRFGARRLPFGATPDVMPGPPAPPAAVPTSSCWGQSETNVIRGDHFEVQWSDGVVSESNANELLEALEWSWEVEVDTYGWNPTSGSDEFLLPVWITNEYSGGAYTTVDYCGGTTQPYIVFGSDSFYDMDWARTAAAHEFNHAIQFSTSYAPSAFWWEATATYVEDAVYPDINYWGWYVGGYSDMPQIRIDADGYSDQDEFYHMYGMAIFGFYLEDHQGGMDMVRQTWAAAEDERSYYDFGIADMVEAVGVDWDAAYLDFITRNAAMDYTQHRYFPEVDEVENIESLPAGGEPSTKQKPEGYGQNYIRFEAGAGEGTLRVTLEVDDSQPWAVVLAEVDKDSVLRSVSTVIESDEGEIEIDTFGEEDVVLVVSPLSDASKGQDYSWSAEIAPEEAEVVDEDDGAKETDTGEDSTTACGCSAGSTPIVGFGIALAALMLRRRRM